MARHMRKEKLFPISIKICFFLMFWPTEKGTHFKFQWNFTKKEENWLKHFFLLYLICYIAQNYFIWTTRNLCLRIYFYIAPIRSQKILMVFFSLLSLGGNTLPGACSDLDLNKECSNWKPTVLFCLVLGKEKLEI